MKKRIIAVVSATALAITTFVACNKSDNKIETSNQQLSTMSASSCVTVDFNSADFGELHNQYVISLYNGVNFSNLNNAKTQILNNFKNMQVDASVFNMTEEDFKNSVLSVNQELSNHKYDLREWSNNPLANSNLYPYVVKILNEIDNITNLSTFNSKLNSIEQEAINNLTCSDLDLVLGTLKVAKSSAKLWAPTSMGGDGLFDNTFGNNPPQLLKGWKGAVVGDASGSAAYFTTMGIGMAVGWAIPGANVAILGMWALSAGVASATGALGF